MLDKILLFMMKIKLRRYKKDCEWYYRQGAEPNWYDEQGAEPNWYDEQGIPNLEKEIKELENKIKRG